MHVTEGMFVEVTGIGERRLGEIGRVYRVRSPFADLEFLDMMSGQTLPYLLTQLSPVSEEIRQQCLHHWKKK